MAKRKDSQSSSNRDKNIRNGEKREDLKLSEIWDRIKEGGGFIFVVWGGQEKSDEETEDKFEKLKSLIKDKDLSYYIVEGRWKNQTTGDLYTEPALLIPYKNISPENFNNLADSIARRFTQDGVIVASPGNENIGRVVDSEGDIIREFNDTSYDTVLDIYLSIKEASQTDRELSFEDFYLYRPSSWSEALVYKSKGGL